MLGILQAAIAFKNNMGLRYRRKKFYIFSFVFLLSISAAAQQRVITGKVTDAKTKLPLSSCSVYAMRSGNGVITNEEGEYVLSISDKTDSIAISMVGYKPVKMPVTKELTQLVNFEAETAPGSMEDVSVSVKSKYTRAQRLVRLVIKNKQKHDVYVQDNFSAKVYDKVELDIKNVAERIAKSKLLKPLAFVLEHVDSTSDNQKYLPVYLSETIADFYYRNRPERERYDYTAIKSSGVDNTSILTYIDGLYKKINVYDNNIKLVDVNFVSPIADNALNAYKYFINDTMLIDGRQCIQVQFSQIQYGTNTFNGFMWIVDSTYEIKSMTMHMDKSASINFVNKFEITQNFELNGDRYLPSKNILFIDLNIPAMKKLGVIAKKTTLFQNFSINRKSIDTIFNKKINDLNSIKLVQTNPDYWKENRFEPLSKTEQFVYTLMDTITKIPAIIKYTKIADALASGYYTTGNIDIGNIFSFYTSNLIEGNRFNVGAKTNWRFNKNIQFKSYVGASTKDKQFRYLAQALFVLDRKQWSVLKIRYSNDIASSYDRDDELDQNSILASALRRVKLSQTRLVNNREANVFYHKFFANGFGIVAEAKSSALTPFFNVYYTYGNFTPYIMSKPGINQTYNTNQVSFTLRYAFKEKFITQHFRRGSLGSNYPIMYLRYSKGIKVNNGILKSDFNYDKWELDVTHDFSLGRLGQLSYILQGGITNGVLPIVLLNVQKGNDTYYYNPYAFNNMNRYEFVSDKHISLMLQHNFGSFPFNYLPAIKKLKWRSLFTFKGVYGDMSEANKIANAFYNNTLPYRFTIPNKTPYMETGVGIENIFRLLRLDAVWRLNYLNNPNIPKFGIKGSIQFKF